MVDVGIEQHTGEPNGALTTIDSAQRAAEATTAVRLSSTMPYSTQCATCLLSRPLNRGPPVLPRQVWINPPPEKTTPQEALGATFSGHPIPELPPDSSYPDAIASEPNRDRTALTPRPSLIEAH